MNFTKFPYNDLREALWLVKAIEGKSCLRIDLAESLGVKVTSTFRTKLVSAAFYGLVTSKKGEVILTDLGKRMQNSSDFWWEGRTQAFFAVPLYNQIYKKYKTKTLPKSYDLNKELVCMGVSPKQVNKARCTFMRTARQSGFFNEGAWKLVAPVNDNLHEKKQLKKQLKKQDFNPLIQGLIEYLPREGVSWSSDYQEKWLKTAKSIFGLLYDD